jgi:hypothetical protein
MLQLQDGESCQELALQPEWRITQEAPLPHCGRSAPTWRVLFQDGAPRVDPKEACLAVPLFPRDGELADDVAIQTLLIEEILDWISRLRPERRAAEAQSILIDNWDGVVSEIIGRLPGSCTVLFSRPAFAQRQAQRVWDRMAGRPRPSHPIRTIFLPRGQRDHAYARSYHLIFQWISFDAYTKGDWEHELQAIERALMTDGIAVLVGPACLAQFSAPLSLELLMTRPVSCAAGVTKLRTILPDRLLVTDHQTFRVDPRAMVCFLKKI